MNKLKMGIFMCLALMLVLTALVGGCTKQEPIVIRLATAAPPTDPMVLMAEELKTTIPEATNGRVQFEIYPGGVLYGWVEQWAALSAGDIEMSIGGCLMTPVSPGWSAFTSCPFLIDDEAHMLRVVETEGFKTFLDKIEAKQGIIQVTYLGNSGAMDFFNNKHPIAKIEDFAGLKFWAAPDPMLLDVLHALGISTVPLDPAEMVTSLETGLVDGSQSGPAGIESWNLKENCPYRTKVGIFQSPFTFVANAEWWHNLPPDIRQTLQGIFTDFGKRCQAMFREHEKTLNASFESYPETVVTVPDEAELERWKALTDPVVEEYMAKEEEVRMVVEAAESVR